MARLRIMGRRIAILALVAAFGFPLYWTVTMAFKPGPEWNPPSGRVFWVPEHPTLDNFKSIFGLKGQRETPFLAQPTRSARGPIENSLIAAGGGTALALLVGVLAAYGIARFRAGGRLLPFQILQLRLFPPIVFVIPIFFVWVQLHLWDTLQGLVILYGAVTFPFVVWLMRSFFLEVPREISEAAIVDGCSHWGALARSYPAEERRVWLWGRDCGPWGVDRY